MRTSSRLVEKSWGKARTIMSENNHQTTRDFGYQPLSSPHHIRLLQIIATGNNNLPPCYDLITIDLDENPPYTALSYTWGNPLSDEDHAEKKWPNQISRLVLKDGQSIPIGQNLNTALRYFSEMGIYGDIWIDATCINQSDTEERSAQVAIMGDIYATAERVLVWLGEEDWNSKVAIVFLEKFLPKIESLMEREEGKDRDFSYSFIDPGLYDRIGEPMIPQDIFDGLASFLERAWFKRAWTFQEIVLAQNIQAVCGSTYVDWDKLEKLLEFLELSDWDMRLTRFQDPSRIQQIPGRMIRSTMVYRHHIAHGGPYEPLQREYLERLSAGNRPNDLLMAELDALLYSMRCRKATDIRDHVYAMYGIVDRFAKQMNISNPLVFPGYHKSVEEAYNDHSRAILQNSRTLLLLSNVEDRPDDSCSSLPSWVPNFSVDASIGLPRTGSGNYYDAFPNSTCHILTSLDPKILILEAFRFDTIIAIGESDFELGAGKVPFTKCAKMLLALPSKYHNGQDRAEALWRTLIADQAHDQCPAPAHTVDAFHEHMLMFCSMAMLDPRKSPNAGENDSTLFEPLSRLAASTPDAARTIPSLSEITERKNIYAEIRRFRSLENSEEGIPASQLDSANTMLQETLTAEARALPFSRQLSIIFVSKRLVTTRKGFIGAAPLSVRPGDEVFLLSGGKVPFILRPKEPGVWKLVGESYIHGIMHGEAFQHEGMRRMLVNLV